MATKENKKALVLGVFLRIGLFLAYYIMLILFGLLLIWGVWKASIWLIFDFLFNLEYWNIRALVIGVIGWLCVIISVLQFAVFLVLPLFSFRKNQKKGRVEVTDRECPELFSLIRETAQQTECPMPKHVYLTGEVNAYVFYNTSFWSIFLPIRKNLEIGLGLFEGMSTDELKAILAHEFGHFSQKTMKVGSTVYVVNTMLSRLVYNQDIWDRYFDWGKYSLIASFLVNQVDKLTRRMYGIVQRSNLQLSRLMEYEADDVACECVGCNVFISAMYKVELLSERDEQYNGMLRTLVLNEKEIVSNYFVGQRIFDRVVIERGGVLLAYDSELAEAVTQVGRQSKITMNNLWDSHPKLSDRIANAQRHSPHHQERMVSAWTLVNEATVGKISERMLEGIQDDAGIDELKIVEDEKFQEWVRSVIEANTMPEVLKPFFDRRILPFRELAKSTTPIVESPLNDRNKETITNFEALLSDVNILKRIAKGEIEAENICYDGKEYEKKKLPIEKLETELNRQGECVMEIDAHIYQYLLAHMETKQEAKEQFDVSFLYRALFYADYMLLEEIQNLDAHTTALKHELSRKKSRDEDEYNALCQAFYGFQLHTQSVIGKSDFNIMAPFIDDDAFNPLQSALQEELKPSGFLAPSILNDWLGYATSISAIHRFIYDKAKRGIIEVAKNVFIHPGDNG